MDQQTAYFVYRPRRLDEIQVPHLISTEHPYEIVAEVSLAAIDYENFCEGMDVDRQFIEDNYELTGEGAIYRCIFVHRKGRKDGILVVPYEKCFVKRAAYLA